LITVKSPSVVTVGDPDVVPEYAVVLTRRITTPEPPLAPIYGPDGLSLLPPPPPPRFVVPVVGAWVVPQPPLPPPP
jgi:hypothetical protein